jgi:hypothetical protein
MAVETADASTKNNGTKTPSKNTPKAKNNTNNNESNNQQVKTPEKKQRLNPESKTPVPTPTSNKKGK